MIDPSSMAQAKDDHTLLQMRKTNKLHPQTLRFSYTASVTINS